MNGRFASLRAGFIGISTSAVLIGALAWPMLFTNSSFGGDWFHHLWFVWHQSLNIRANHVPGLFLDTSFSVYYPQYAFYGGTIYALAGALALAPGSSPATAYVFTYLLGLMAAYWGWYWIGRIAGLGRWFAHVPGLTFATSAAYLTLIYGRGDWPEFLGVSMIPLMIASGASVVKAKRLNVGPSLALAGSSIVFFGSHDLTILWASTLFVITGLIILACIPDARCTIRGPVIARLAGLVVPALLVSAWYLLPTVAYASHTQIGHSGYVEARQTLRATIEIVSWHNLFTLSRANSVYGVPGFALSLPILAIFWALASIPISIYSGRLSTEVRMLLIFSGVTVVIVVLMTNLGMLLALPKPYELLQFSYRLENYVLVGLSAIILTALVVVQKGTRRVRVWRWTIVPVLVVSAIGAIQQTDAYPHAIPRDYVTAGFVGEAFAQKYLDYSDESLPIVDGESLPDLNFPLAAVHSDRVSVSTHLPAGRRVLTNIDTGPYLVQVTGATVVGRAQDGFLVLALDPNAPARRAARHPASTPTETISLGPATGLPIELGRILTVMGMAILAIQIIRLLLMGRWRAAPRS
jgi:hypothetical protein